jgi:NSS family neurotransmitter:Na+ symporter
MFYYPVVTGWFFGYIFVSIFQWDALVADPTAVFADFSSGWGAGAASAVALAATVAILMKGVTDGIEKICKYLMPVLVVLLVALCIRSVTLPGAWEGMKFLFYPDFSKLTLGGALDALGHSFYSISVGMGIMVTYGSYMKKSQSLPQASVSIVSLDILCAVLAGIAIFPAVFATGLDPAGGTGLTFVTLPSAFAQIPFGRVFAAMFFFLVFLAGLMSLISILQVPLAMLEDTFKMSRKKGLVIMSIITVVLGTPAVLSSGVLADFKIAGMDYFTLLDTVANNFILPITALLGCAFVVLKMKVKVSKEEFLIGAKNPKTIIGKLYPAGIMVLAPIAIIVILIRGLGII